MLTWNKKEEKAKNKIKIDDKKDKKDKNKNQVEE